MKCYVILVRYLDPEDLSVDGIFDSPKAALDAAATVWRRTRFPLGSRDGPRVTIRVHTMNESGVKTNHAVENVELDWALSRAVA